MDMKIIKEKDVLLLDRKRVIIMAKFEGKATPSGDTLRNDVAKLVKADPKVVSIRHIYQQYGNGQAKVIAHVYKDEKKLKQFEGERAMLKEAPKKEAPVVEAPKEELKAEEVPKEEAAPAKESPKGEEKSE